MTLSAILAAITSLGAIVGGVVYLFKYSAWALQRTPESKREAIDADVADRQRKADETGRPQ